MFNRIKNFLKIDNRIHKNEDTHKTKTNVTKDLNNIIFLLLLYTIQGVPMGVSSVIPLIIQDKLNYSQLSLFSLINLPFSLKLLWAPIVDSVYSKTVGRRKTWIIPIQSLCSFFMIYFSNDVLIWLGEGEKQIDLYYLTLFFFILFFLMATQDIAVDGWALTMLSEENKHYASTCNILGQNIGFCLSQLSFLTLNNKKICFYIFKKYIRIMSTLFYNSSYYRNLNQNIELMYPSFHPFVDMNSFLKFWGLFILVLTIFSCFKNEKSEIVSLNDEDNEEEEEEGITDKDDERREEEEEEEHTENIKDAYKKLYQLMFLPPIKLIIILFLLSRFPFSSVEVGTDFKILKRGITKEEFALFNPFHIPIALISPALISQVMNKLNPLDVYYFGYGLRFLSNLLLASLLPITHYMYSNKESLHSWYFYLYYLYILLTHAFNHICVDLMTTSSMGFQNLISDPKIGGTYMTFLNTVNNLGSKWSKILFLWLFDYTDREFCFNGICFYIDGYYSQMLFSLIMGIVLRLYILKCIKKIQAFPMKAWRTDWIQDKKKKE